MLIDTHAHLYVDNYRKDLSEVVLRAQQAQVQKGLSGNYLHKEIGRAHV